MISRHLTVAFLLPENAQKARHMKRKLIAIVLTVLVLGAGIGGYEAVVVKHHDTSPTATSTSQSAVAGTLGTSLGGKQVTYTGVTGRTALQNLQALTRVGVTDTSYGKMVVSINGVSAVSGKTYWAFYVNGSYANEGADTYITRAGDKFMWKLEDITQ